MRVSARDFKEKQFAEGPETMWKPDALQAKSLEVDPEAEQNTASDLRLDAAVQIWDRWTIPMYLEVTLAGLQRTAN